MRENINSSLSNACKNIYPKLIYSICSIHLKYYTQFLNNSRFINYPFSYCVLFNDLAKKIHTNSVFGNPQQTNTYLKSTMKTLEKDDVVLVYFLNIFRNFVFCNFEHISHHFLGFPLLNLNKKTFIGSQH